MAFTKDQKEPSLPIGADTSRSSVNFLPRYFRTSTNQKFLNGTLDQLISVGNVDKVNAYIGRKTSKAYTVSDNYVDEISTERAAYQLEPAVIVKDSLENVTFFSDYNDYINQLMYFNLPTADHNKINSQEFYSWNPNIDWDKFVNYREYYWLPRGPQSIAVKGQSRNIISTYTVTVVNDVDNIAYIFSPDGLTRNPSLKLYRGQTYKFDINCPGNAITFKTVRDPADSFIYTKGVVSDTAYVEIGTIVFTIPDDAPDILYYVSATDVNSSGFFKIYDIEENTFIDVENEILGKKTYNIDGTTELSNGMKVNFIGNVTPEKYATDNWYVEGVGDKIKLVAEYDLRTPSSFASDSDIEFDTENFDTQGFDVNSNYPSEKDYITINRASKDSNHWSRYNRWFHKSVIETSAAYNNQPVDIDQGARAKRPIIEFKPDLQLWNFGSQAKRSVDLIDLFTKDAFSTIEGSIGYNIDGVLLLEGMRVLFAADTDALVNGRIFKIGFVTHFGVKRLTLLEEPDAIPMEGESVLINDGDNFKGKMFHYASGAWIASQDKTNVNIAPLFDVVDADAISFGNRSAYIGSSFAGSKIFSYSPGDTYDNVLTQNINYRNIGNIGDIVFDFNLQKDKFTYQGEVELIEQILDKGYLKVNNSLTEYNLVNGWVKSEFETRQPIVRQLTATIDLTNLFPIDVYSKSGLLSDLDITVFVNNKKRTDYEIYRQNSIAYVQFTQDLTINDVIVIETMSSATKLDNIGYYKFPSNFESNPQNLSLADLTLGQISNHLKTISENFANFQGSIPGDSNLRDLGNISGYGTQVVQHSSPLAPIVYSFTNKHVNIIKSLRYARDEYSKFKRNLIRTATTYGYDGITKTHLDLILGEVTKDKPVESPFYLSDMVPFGINFVYEQEIIDDSFTDYPLTFDFNLSEASAKAVLVYVNDDILLHDRDYIFINTSFIRILSQIQSGDILKIYQYEETAGCCVPPTPTKLGLYPLFEPKIFVDDTYRTPTKVIQGHDGSITVAFSNANEPNEFRDELLLELETRIFNNIKVRYNPSLFNLDTLLSGYFRTGDVSSTELNTALRQEFLNWTSLVNEDYTKHTFFDRNDPFTYNYKSFSNPKSAMLPGFWRAIYKQFYDTDRPHTHPWEMLGFSIKPTWWEEQYGPAPYTRDNLLLWNDLADGLIRTPGQLPTRNSLYARPDLLKYLPVDSNGNLIDPLTAGMVADYVSVFTENEFTFGDQTPIETAWRRSSQYPFSLITALTLLRPAKIFALGFDRIRQYRDATGQIIYKLPTGNARFNSSNMVFPSTVKDSTRVFTSGLVNYLTDYGISKSFDILDNFKSDLNSLQVKISSKLAGFTTKEKFKLILDSRSPLNDGNVFIPPENYKIILNSSTPVTTINYSGVIVEKTTSGFVIRGYNKLVPEFNYKKVAETVSDPVISVGGISETFVDWNSGKFYNKGQIVKTDQNYYRVTTSHTSTTSFESKYFAKLPSLPVIGGRQIVLRRNFENTISTLHYGAELTTVQDVVDFLLGYGKYLLDAGFIFEYFNTNLRTITDWQTSAKEFTFWTTQNWAEGSVITLSPAAEELIYKQEYAVVDSIYDPFYEYSIFKQDGVELEPSFTNTIREKNTFNLRPKNTADGLYHATLNLVQKEHVLILDDITVFNDVIYDQVQGYRQDRIKVVGYKISDWAGDFSIPGFVYDRAITTEWTAWKDYSLGETVKYKEFYYSAIKNIPGTELFNDDDWYKLNDKPEAKLIPNWDYRATQFEDFYDLDTDSFDVDQQKFAQHLIGYQKRQYLENIINDDVSQYKFYQGMIQEKGTQNSLSKLFDALNFADTDSLEFFEEWAIRLGQYGANGGFDEVEYVLNEEKFLINPQPIELVNSVPFGVNDFVYRITQDQVYLKPDDYTHEPFPVLASQKEYIKTAGYVNYEDVDYVITSKDDFATFNIKNLREGQYFWLGFDNSSWNVYRFTNFAKTVKRLEETANLRFVLISARPSDIVVGSYIGINNTNSSVEGIRQVVAVGLNWFEISMPADIDTAAVLEINDTPNINLFKFTSQRLTSIDDLNSLPVSSKKNNELVWTDGINNAWSVWKFTKTYTNTTIISEENNFASAMAVDTTETVLVASASNAVRHYSRPTVSFGWAFQDSIFPLSTETFTETYGSFGDSLCFSADGSYLFIGAPKYGQDVIVGGPGVDDIITPTNTGYVAQYTKNIYGSYEFTRVIQNSAPTTDQNFGQQIQVNGNVLYIVSKGNGTTVAAAISAYNLTTNTFLATQAMPAGISITDIDVASNNTVTISKDDESVLVLRLSGLTFVTVQEINISDVTAINVIETGSNFATSVSITKDANFIAIGAPSYSGTASNQGAVIIFKLNSSTYVADDFITSPLNQNGEKFGYRVRFNLDNDRLVIYSYGGNQTVETSIDSGNTTFDLSVTKFIEEQEFVGSVRVYEKYDTKFLFGDELEPSSVLGINYGDAFVVAKKVYVNDYTTNSGAFYEFSGTVKSWSKFREPEPSVDLSKIKSAFLYNTRTNSIVTNLDFIDPITGKVLGIAEQELSFKTYYDPAIYSIGIETVVVDLLMGWTTTHVGKLWWDLSTIKFANPLQGSIVYKANTWNNVYNDATVDVYEWVQSEYTPSEWDSLADTETGLALGISGISKYGDLAYSIKQSYDNVSNSFKNIYYFWVKNKVTVPDASFRKISASDVSRLISDPKGQGIQYATLLGKNQFALVNCKGLITGKDIALNIRYWTINNTENNIHAHYQLLAEGNTNKKINKYIEQKWFDSLIGYDINGAEVPDTKLPAKLKYGILNKPRQGMFINRLEALKQFIERVNSVLIKQAIIDDFDFTKLNDKDIAPTEISGKFDIAIDSQSQIRFVGSTGFIQATVVPVVEAGKITRVVVINPGRGYKISPAITITGNGTGAKLTARINSTGEVTGVTVDNSGRDYLDTTTLFVRPFTILVNNDETASNKWSLYTWDSNIGNWFRSKTQVYDVTKHWNYADWYADGYSAFTKVDHQVDFSYEMSFIDIAVGDLVKIKNEKSGGWILLERIDTQITDNVSLNYNTVGRQNGTIQFNSNLYKFINSNIGFDSFTYDGDVYDDEPKEELRIILDVIKNNLLVDNLEVEYNKLFFSSLRYVFSEQPFVDWAFKTSFVKSQHNLGELRQKINYKNDNLSSYEDYINEVKPYRSKIREFISNYTAKDNTYTGTTDFDLPARYDAEEGKIVPFSVKVFNSAVTYNSTALLNAPYSDWLDNLGYRVVEIAVTNGGTGYQAAPAVEIVGNSKVKATATAYISQGAVTRIVVEIGGEGYLTTPSVIISGSVGTTGTPATATAILGEGLSRTSIIGVKFDRIIPEYQVSSITMSQTFSGTGSRTMFELTWPVDIRTNKTAVIVSNEELLSSDFKIYNKKDTSLGYTRYIGVMELTSAAELGNANVSITYTKDIRLLSAADRIQYYYAPETGQLGKDLGQLMQGVDYGGVEVTGLGFEISSGWDGLPWFTSGWDDFDEDYTDFLVVSDGTTRSYNLPYILEDGEQINIYLNGVRIDDANYDEYTSAEQEYNASASQLSTFIAEELILQADKDAKQEIVDNLTQELIDTQEVIANLEAQLAITPPSDPLYFALQVTLAENQVQETDLIAELSIKQAELNTAQSLLTAKELQISVKTVEVAAKLAVLNNAPTIVNDDAQMQTFYGDGSTDTPIVIPADVDVNSGDKIIFRKSTSDGSFRPNRQFLDSEIVGGDFSYTTARGLRSEDIILDGDNFVTTTTSYAPEEVITGQIVDSVAITVYHAVEDGTPIIVTRHYITTQPENEFLIGQRPNTTQAAIVKLNGLIKEQDIDYTLNYAMQKIVFLTNLPVGSEVVITSMSKNGTSILDSDSFVGDGTSNEFVTVARWNSDYSALVTVNGIPATVTTFITDNTYSEIGNIGIRFTTPPANTAIIDYTIIGTTLNTVSRVATETVVHDGTSQVYNLNNTPANLNPFENNILVEHAGKILRPADTIYFNVAGTVRTYSVSIVDYAINTVDADQVRVYLNGKELAVSRQYTWKSSSNLLTIKRGVAKTGDKIALVILENAEYYIEPDSTGVQLRLLNSYSADEKFSVTTFTNHDILDIERNNDYVTSASTVIVGTTDYYRLNQLLAGRIQLRNPALGAQYVWLALNGELLTPEIDYILEDNLTHIQIDRNRVLTSQDVIDIIVFSSDVTTGRPFGYTIFKDMLNRTFYKRLDSESSAVLAAPLNYYDTSIVLEDAAGLIQPLRSQNQAGIIFIDKERIEYLEKDGNILKYLRRGTLGTGVPEVHAIGTAIVDASIGQTVPYKDETETVVLVAGGYAQASEIYKNNFGISVSSIKYNFNNNTAFPLGGQVVTVKGTGFTERVEVIIGDPTSLTTFVATEINSANEIIVNSVDRLFAGKEIVFSGAVFGGIDLETSYYILTYGQDTVTEEYYITVSETKGGSPTLLSVSSGAMTGSHMRAKCNTTYVSSTELTFITQAEVVGAYDLVILNPSFVVGPVTVAQSSYVAPGAIKYVQILLPFSPIVNTSTTRNPAETGEWYKETTEISVSNIQVGRGYKIKTIGTTDYMSIGASANTIGTEFIATAVGSGTGKVLDYTSIPLEYWEGLDIEVFVAGRRLNKSPTAVWDESLGPDSPSGDRQLQAEFAVNKNVGAYVRLTETPANGSKIIVQKKVGQAWVSQGQSLVDSQSDQAKFVRAKTASLPR
jgi:hypothetical protein